MSSEPRVSSAAATSVAWTLPNILTYARIALVPVLVLTFFIEGNIGRWIAVGIFVAASITDYVDGYIARALKQQSSLGTMLDPIADKLLVAAALLLLAADETIAGISLFAAVIILSREILVSGLREYLASLQVSVPVTQLAKWKTAIQMLAVTFLLCGPEGRELYPFTSELGITLLWVAALLTLYTGYDYFRAGMHHVIAADDRNAQRDGDDACARPSPFSTSPACVKPSAHRKSNCACRTASRLSARWWRIWRIRMKTSASPSTGWISNSRSTRSRRTRIHPSAPETRLPCSRRCRAADSMPVRIQPEPFDAGAELMALTSGRADIGASVTFVGQVRDLSGGEKLHTMTLEHYPAMAQAELERIEAEARTRFEVQDIEIIHRFGDLTPGDPIVLVIATSASRQPAFDAANFVMDFLKTNAPFWKKEHGEDSSHWVEARKSDDAATEKWQRR